MIMDASRHPACFFLCGGLRLRAHADRSLGGEEEEQEIERF